MEVYVGCFHILKNVVCGVASRQELLVNIALVVSLILFFSWWIILNYMSTHSQIVALLGENPVSSSINMEKVTAFVSAQELEGIRAPKELISCVGLRSYLFWFYELCLGVVEDNDAPEVVWEHAVRNKFAKDHGANMANYLSILLTYNGKVKLPAMTYVAPSKVLYIRREKGKIYLGVEKHVPDEVEETKKMVVPIEKKSASLDFSYTNESKKCKKSQPPKETVQTQETTFKKVWPSDSDHSRAYYHAEPPLPAELLTVFETKGVCYCVISTDRSNQPYAVMTIERQFYDRMKAKESSMMVSGRSSSNMEIEHDGSDGANSSLSVAGVKRLVKEIFEVTPADLLDESEMRNKQKLIAPSEELLEEHSQDVVPEFVQDLITFDHHELQNPIVSQEILLPNPVEVVKDSVLGLAPVESSEKELDKGSDKVKEVIREKIPANTVPQAAAKQKVLKGSAPHSVGSAKVANKPLSEVKGPVKMAKQAVIKGKNRGGSGRNVKPPPYIKEVAWEEPALTDSKLNLDLPMERGKYYFDTVRGRYYLGFESNDVHKASRLYKGQWGHFDLIRVDCPDGKGKHKQHFYRLPHDSERGTEGRIRFFKSLREKFKRDGLCKTE